MSTSLRHLFVMACLLTVVTGLHTAQPTAASDLSDCLDLGFSVEQSFLTQGPVPPNGNPIISDGDLLAPHGAICARNTELLAIFSITEDLGLDAVAVVGSTPVIAAFSTEIDDPGGSFTAGDLLSTNGAIVANEALVNATGVTIALGLDAVVLEGDPADLHALFSGIASSPLPNPQALAFRLGVHDVDILFSTEMAAPSSPPQFIAGDLISARYGTVIARNSDLLPSSVPAGIPQRGVDFGLDAVSADGATFLFSTELTPAGLDAGGSDLLDDSGRVRAQAAALIAHFEPLADELGLDAVSGAVPYEPLGWLTGTVLDMETGMTTCNPAAITVNAMPATPCDGCTAADGPIPLAPDTYAVLAQADGYQGDTQNVTVFDDGTTMADFYVSRPMIGVAPVSVAGQAEVGQTVEVSLVLWNDGHVASSYSVGGTGGWLNVVPASGTVPALGATAPILVIQCLTQGTVTTSLVVDHEDPCRPAIEVAVTATCVSESLLFANNFESGDLSGWSSATP